MQISSSTPRLISRRWFLAGTAATAAALAGCSSSTSSTSSDGATPAATASAGGAAAAGSVAALAQAFYTTLDADLQSSVLLDYSLAYAKRWSNLPQALISGGGMGSGGAPSGSGSGGPPSGGSQSGMPSGAAPSGSTSQSGGAGSSSARVGINLGQLGDDQLAALDTLLKAATGTTAGLGYAQLQAQLAADDYLAANGGGDDYGRENYYVALLGSPQDSGTWELQFGGHHFALANTYTDGKLAGATPSFRGVEPNGDFELDGTTYNVMGVKEAAFTAMLTGMSDEQLTAAKLSDAYTDLVLGPGKDWAFPTDREGVQVSTLSAASKKLVLAAIATYVDDIADDDAKTILATYEGELDDTYVAYSGTTTLAERNDYVRIDGPSVWIEYSMQNGIVLSGNHPHTVWRDRNTDYGGTKS